MHKRSQHLWSRGATAGRGEFITAYFGRGVQGIQGGDIICGDGEGWKLLKREGETFSEGLSRIENMKGKNEKKREKKKTPAKAKL